MDSEVPKVPRCLEWPQHVICQLREVPSPEVFGLRITIGAKQTPPSCTVPNTLRCAKNVTVRETIHSARPSQRRTHRTTYCPMNSVLISALELPPSLYPVQQALEGGGIGSCSGPWHDYTDVSAQGRRQTQTTREEQTPIPPTATSKLITNHHMDVAHAGRRNTDAIARQFNALPTRLAQAGGTEALYGRYSTVPPSICTETRSRFRLGSETTCFGNPRSSTTSGTIKTQAPARYKMEEAYLLLKSLSLLCRTQRRNDSSNGLEVCTNHPA